MNKTAVKIDRQMLAEVISRELTRSSTWDVTYWEPERIKGLAYYQGELPAAPADTDLSGAVSMDVADMVEAVLAQMQPAFTGASPVEFDPESEDDEQQAASETFFVHRALSRNGMDFQAVSSALRDAMLARAGLLKVWTDEREVIQETTLEQVPAGSLGMLLQPVSENETVELVTDIDELETMEDGSYESITLRSVKIERTLHLEGVAPENFRLWQDWRKPSLAGCPFQAERKRFVRGELYGLGISDAAIAALPAAQPDIDASGTQRGNDNNHERAVDPDLDEIELWDIYIVTDWASGTGKGELVNCLYTETMAGMPTASAQSILTDPVSCDFTPFAAGQIIIQPHRFLGLSLGDKIGPTQRAKTEVLRQWLDNLAYMNNGRLIVVAGGADPIAVEQNNKPGGVIPSLMKGGVEAIIGPDASQSALAAMNFLDKARGEAGGASLDMQTSGGNLQGQTAAGINRQYGAKELLAGLMLRTFAETALREVYLLGHKNLRAYPPGNMNGKIRGEWQVQDPSTWRPRSLASVQVGVAGSAMQERAMNLRETLQLQMKAMESGQAGEITDKAQMYQTIMALERSKGLENPERYWIDPTSKQAQQAAQGKSQQMQQEKAAQALLMKSIADEQVASQEKMKRWDIALKYFETVVQAEVDEMKVIGAATSQLEALQTTGMMAAAATQPEEKTPEAGPLQ